MSSTRHFLLPAITACVRWMLCALVASCFVFPPSALAWTESQVVGGEVDIAISEDATALVEINLALKVDRGWLSGLEVAQLDSDMVLEDAPQIIERIEVESESPDLKATQEIVDGEVHLPTVKVKEGRVWLSFARKDAPRRGRYRVVMRYRTSLAHRRTQLRDGRLKMWWTMPGWRSGLDAVVIRMSTPPGSVRADTERESVEYDVKEEGHRTVHHWVKAHQPRTMPWEVSVDIDVAKMSNALAQQAPPKPKEVLQAEEETSQFPWWMSLVAFGFFGVALLKRRTHRLLGSAPLLSMGEPLRLLLIGVLCAPLGTLALLPLAEARLAEAARWGAVGCLAIAVCLVLLRSRRQPIVIDKPIVPSKFDGVIDSFFVGALISIGAWVAVFFQVGNVALEFPFIWVSLCALCMVNSGRSVFRRQRCALQEAAREMKAAESRMLFLSDGSMRLWLNSSSQRHVGLLDAQVGFDGELYCLVKVESGSLLEQRCVAEGSNCFLRSAGVFEIEKEALLRILVGEPERVSTPVEASVQPIYAVAG